MDIGAVPPTRFEHCIRTGLNMGAAYTHASASVRAHIAVYTALAVTIDNWEVGSDGIEEFVPRILAGSPQLHPLLDRYLDVLKETQHYFQPYAVSAIVTNAIQFVNSMLLDKHEEETSVQEKSLPYARYKRARNGLGEVFGFFLWDKTTFPSAPLHAEVIAYVFTAPPCMIFR